MYSVWDPPRFTTEHKFNKYGKWDHIEDLMVPFEHYNFHALAFAIDPTTNNSVHIAKFGVLDTLGNFIIRSHDTTDTSNFTYESEDGLMLTGVESRVLRVEIKQSVIAKAFAICLFLGNWAMTIGSVYTTALMASERLEANGVVAALPFSALLAIPTIRSLYSSSSLGVSIGKSVIPPNPFHSLIHSSRRGCVLRTNCDNRLMLPGLIEGLHEMSLITYNGIPCLDL